MTPLRLAREIADSFDPLSDPVEVRTLCYDILVNGYKDPDDALEQAVSVQEKVIRHLHAIAEKAADGAFAARFAINKSSGYFIHGSCFALPSDPADVVEAKKRRSHAWRYASKISELNPIEFEALCCGLLAIMGVEQPSTTKRSGDEGVDFFGRIAIPATTLGPVISPNLASKIYFWVVGQAKHYKKTVAGTPELRDLFGSIELAKAGVTNPIGDAAEDVRVRIADPIVYMFVTSGRISSQARQLLASSGVYGVDGEMVSTFLADNAIGVDDHGDFQDAKFDEWIRGCQG